MRTSKPRRLIVANKVSSTRLTADDLREVGRICSGRNRTEADVLRELVHEALVARRLRLAGRDAATQQVREAQRDMLSEHLAPLRALLEDNARMRKHQLKVLEHIQETLYLLVGARNHRPQS